MLKTLKFIHQHPINWRELLSQPPYSLTIKEDENLILLKYNQINSDFNEEVCRECRGLILSTDTLEPVALSFEKILQCARILCR